MNATFSQSDSPTNFHNVLPRVAYQGAPGAFSELAIRQHWPDGATPVALPTFQSAAASALDGDADFAIIPVENVIAGPVKPALEVLERERSRYTQCGELRLRVQMCLLARPGVQLRELRVVLSHPMALAQCGRFFSAHEWLTAVVHGDTASAAADIASGHDAHAGALASEAAAAHYGLEILLRNVQDSADNWTRFIVLRSNR